MKSTDRNFVSFIARNYDTIRVAFLGADGRPENHGQPAPARPTPAAPSAPGSYKNPPPPWATQNQPWIDQRGPDYSELFSYKIPKGSGIKADDIVIVPAGGKIKMAVVMVVDPVPSLDFTRNCTYKWVIQKLDFTEFNDIMTREADFRNRMEEVDRQRAQQDAIAAVRQQYLDGSPASAHFVEALKLVGAHVPEAPVTPPPYPASPAVAPAPGQASNFEQFPL